MKIVVIADTHIPVSSNSLPDRLCEEFKDCDMIIHAGDILELKVIDQLQKFAETRAVHGNMDSPEAKEKLPETIVLDAGGKSIGVVHGQGSRARIVQNVSAYFKEAPDIIIFGHSHAPLNEQQGPTLFFNPGSPTDRVFSPYRSFGIIEIEGDDIRAKIIKIDDE